MTRGEVRELAVHLIYSQSFTGESPEKLLIQGLDPERSSNLAEEYALYGQLPEPEQQRYLEEAVSGTIAHREELDGQIQRYSIGWNVRRIARITRTILELAIYEITYMGDIPVNASVAEAIRLAQLYDGDESGAFVNGILGTLVRAQVSQEETP